MRDDRGWPCRRAGVRQRWRRLDHEQRRRVVLRILRRFAGRTWHSMFVYIGLGMASLAFAGAVAQWPQSLVRMLLIFGAVTALLVVLALLEAIADELGLIRMPKSACAACGFNLEGVPPTFDVEANPPDQPWFRICPECGAAWRAEEPPVENRS